MRKNAFKTITLALLGSTVLGASAAVAQDDQVLSIYERHRPDYSALGVRSGGFLFHPEISAEGKFDSNIFADNANEVDDFIAIISPSFRLQSDTNNNSFSIFAGADIGKYSDNSNEDYEDFNVGASARIDISRGTNIFADLSFDEKHEDRGSPDESSQLAPTIYSTLTAKAGFKRDEGLLSFAVDGSYAKSDYDDVGTTGQVGFLENDDRDRETLTGTVRLGYDLNEDYEAFVKFTAVKVDYDNSQLEGGPRRDNDGWDIVGGAAFDISGKSKGEFYVGYIKRDWDSATLAADGNVSDFTFGASLLWVGDLTSLKLSVDRGVTETTAQPNDFVDQTDDPSAAGLLTTRFGARVEHELQRNLLLSADASFTKMDFVNTFRKDDVIDAGVGFKYLVNRTFSLNADYKYGERASDQPFSDYDRHSFMVSLTAQW